MPVLTAQSVYENAVRELPAPEKLRLASLILNELAEPKAVGAEAAVWSDEWSEEDVTDLTAFLLKYAASEDSGDEAMF